MERLKPSQPNPKMKTIWDCTVKIPEILSSRTYHENRAKPETFCNNGYYRKCPQTEYFGINLAFVIKKHTLVYKLNEEVTIKTMKPSDHPVNLNDDWSKIAKTRCLQQLNEGNLLGALFWVQLMIKFKINSLLKSFINTSKLRHLLSFPCI